MLQLKSNEIFIVNVKLTSDLICLAKGPHGRIKMK